MSEMEFDVFEGRVTLVAGMLSVTPRVFGRVVDVYRVTESYGCLDAELVAVVGDETTARRLIPDGWGEIRCQGSSFWRRPGMRSR
jgi:hypothetical protein